MPDITFFIGDKDKTGAHAGAPRCHPHEAVLNGSQQDYTLHFRNRAKHYNVKMKCEELGIEVMVPQGGDASVKADVSKKEGWYGFSIVPYRKHCPKCGQELQAEWGVAEVSGGSEEAVDGDPVIIIIP